MRTRNIGPREKSARRSLAAAFLAAAIMAGPSCRMVEVSSLPRNFTVVIEAARPGDYSLHQYDRSGKYRPVERTGKGRYSVRIPMMDGGFSQFLFVRYNRHNPEEYKIIQVRKGGAAIRELSIRDLETLPLRGETRVLRAE